MELFMKAKGSIVNLFHAELVLCIPRSVSTNPRQRLLAVLTHVSENSRGVTGNLLLSPNQVLARGSLQVAFAPFPPPLTG
jgi:hypothetical protein